VAAVSEAAALDRRPIVVVADTLELRRAGVVGLMQEWSEAHRVELRSVDPALGYELIEDGATCVLGMLNLGFHSITLPDTQDWVRRFKDRFPDAPLVVVSDREEAEDVLIAFRGGAQGFIPTSTKPVIALQALSFIMNGGSFFPPGTLLRLPRRRQDSAGKGERRAARVTLVHVRQDCQSIMGRAGNRAERRDCSGADGESQAAVTPVQRMNWST
jgi:DNA-binding NarL/FixJ family response regulator